MKFNFMAFGIILISTFLLVYKLFNYIIKSDLIKSKSKTDIVFLTIFFIFLFIPMSHINQDDISEKENRTLAQWKPLISDNKINFNFGKNFDEWFNDRFTFKNLLTSINSRIKITISFIYRTKKVTYDKKYNILYDNLSFLGLDLNNDYTIEEFSQKLLKNFQLLNTYCKKRNIKLYILFVPRWADFYQHRPINLKLETHDYLDYVVEYIRNNSDINLIYPKNEMLKANNKTPVYFRTDHHWTKKGAFIGYTQLLNKIVADFPDTYILKESELLPYYDNKVQTDQHKTPNNGFTFRISGLPDSYADKLLNTQYLYYKNPKNKDLINITDIKYSRKSKDDYDEEFIYKFGSDKRVILISNSFGLNLVEFLPYSFKHTLRLYDNYRNMNMSIYEPIIQDYKPDIIILCFQSEYLKRLLNMYPNNRGEH